MKKFLALLSLSLFLHTAGFSQSPPAELPAIKSPNAADFFIPADVIKRFGLDYNTGDAWMKRYTGLNMAGKMQIAFDIRWEATSESEALSWYYANKKLLSEDGNEITAKTTKPIGVDAWNVYEASDAMKKMMEGMGMKQNQYTHTFVVGKYVVKIFVGVDENTSVNESWSFVKEGLKAVLRASGNPNLASLVL